MDLHDLSLQRKHLPLSYQTLESEHSTPLYAADAFPLAPFDIEPYRRMLQVDAEKLEVSRTVDKAAFWDGMTQSVAESWKAVEVRSRRHYCLLS